MEETRGGEDKQLGPEEELSAVEEENLPRVMVMPHELGGIKVVVRSADGTVAQGRININEASLIAAHLQALITMAFGTAYNQAAAQTQELERSGVIIPGR